MDANTWYLIQMCMWMASIQLCIVFVWWKIIHRDAEIRIIDKK